MKFSDEPSKPEKAKKHQGPRIIISCCSHQHPLPSFHVVAGKNSAGDHLCLSIAGGDDMKPGDSIEHDISH